MFMENEFAEKVEILGEALVVGATEIANVIVNELSQLCEDLEFCTDDDAVQYVIEVVVFYMHLVDRSIFAKLGPVRREVFQDNFVIIVLRLLQKQRGDTTPNFEKALREIYNYRQLFYSQFKDLVPNRNEQLKDTLCWEFSKVLFECFKDTNPVTLVSINIIVVRMTSLMVNEVIDCAI